MELHAMIADYQFDFTNAFIPDRETRIVLTGWIGDIDIVIPEDLAVSIKGEGRIVDYNNGEAVTKQSDGKDVFYETPGFQEASRKVVMEISYKILNVTVDRV